MTTTRLVRTAGPLAVAVVAVAVALGVAVASGGRHAAAAVVDPSAATVTVSGAGTVQGVPDTLTATLDAHVTRPSVQSALDGVAAAARRVIGAFRHAGLPARDVRTSGLDLNPRYGDHGTLVGYDANERITARISPLAHAGRILSSASGAAGNAVSVEGLTFDIVDDHSLLGRARSAAYADAKDRASQYAGLSGQSLGRVERISETVRGEQSPYPFDDALGQKLVSAAASVPIRPGQQPVTVTVTVTWSLR